MRKIAREAARNGGDVRARANAGRLHVALDCDIHRNLARSAAQTDHGFVDRRRARMNREFGRDGKRPSAGVVDVLADDLDPPRHAVLARRRARRTHFSAGQNPRSVRHMPKPLTMNTASHI